jgi:hypothetical protein
MYQQQQPYQQQPQFAPPTQYVAPSGVPPQYNPNFQPQQQQGNKGYGTY